MKTSAKERRYNQEYPDPDSERRARRGLLAAGVTAALLTGGLLAFTTVILLIGRNGAGALATFLLAALLFSGAVGVIVAMR